jgi:hypothetical protein
MSNHNDLRDSLIHQTGNRRQATALTVQTRGIFSESALIYTTRPQHRVIYSLSRVLLYFLYAVRIKNGNLLSGIHFMHELIELGFLLIKRR